MAAMLPARRYEHRAPSHSGRIVRSTRHTATRRTTAAAPRSGQLRAPAADAARAAARRPHLRLVARPRLAINAALLLVGAVVSLMLAAVVLHTRLAERQVEIDRVESAVTEARSRFDLLRQQRAELRAPNRLAAVGAEQGMVPSPAAEFLPVDPWTVADVLVASGPADGELGDFDDTFEPLDQIRRVKAAAGD
jgi:hypothetical protein